MKQENLEKEVKFYLANLPGLAARLKKMGAALQRGRVFESNLRFDTPSGELTAAHRVLRLRQDERIRLTYKGPADITQPVSARPEIEFEVSSFENARAFLEALGYQVSIRYEKYRTTYAFMDTEVTLDEMPFGDFAEIEGHNTARIQAAASALGLDWEARCTESYLALFNYLRASQNLQASHLTFAEVRQKYPPHAFNLLRGDPE